MAKDLYTVDGYGVSLAGFHTCLASEAVGSLPAEHKDRICALVDTAIMQMFNMNHQEVVFVFRALLKEIKEYKTEEGWEWQVVEAISHWGIAYAQGVNYNKNFMTEEEAEVAMSSGKTAMQTIEKCKDKAPLEFMLIEALQCRCGSPSELEKLNVEYCAAMEKVYKACQDNVDIAALYAEALMNLRPWKLWEKSSAGEIEGNTYLAKDILEKALQQHPSHPALCHYYIHLMEMSPTPETCMPQCDQLRTSYPDFGHLVHMPSHIDMQIGNYGLAVTGNEAALVSDLKFCEMRGYETFYFGYPLHNYLMIVWASFFSGQFQKALNASEEIVKMTPKSMLDKYTDFLEPYLATKWHVLVRFGKWEKILELELPEDQTYYSVCTATAHYAKGVAYAALGRPDEGEQEIIKFRAAMEKVPQERILHNVPSKSSLGVAEQMLLGEVRYRQQRYEEAYDHLRKGVELELSLPYDEPAGWMQPVRHAHGALLLEQDQFETAMEVLEADLLVHPKNMWALLGLQRCYENLKMSEKTETTKAALQVALAQADGDYTSPCLCAREKKDCCSK
eukprot:m.260682 g.260682  ORF g.260682 m.260682 type:complete len:562 (-) comp16213_c6_seq1:28-1713(-)